MAWKLIEKVDSRLADEVNLTPPAAGGDVRIALCYPNTYFVGMSNLGFQALYGLLNREPGVVCERSFLPDPEDLDEYRRSASSLFSLESKTPLQEFDIVGFSCSYELDFVNLLRMLDLAGIPLRAEDRDESWPLVLMGGAISFLNPEPLGDFIDALVVGEGEEAVRQIVALWRQGGRGPRADLLKALATLPGVYVPSLYKHAYSGSRIASCVMTGGAAPHVKRLAVEPLDFPTHTSIITPHTEFSRSFLLEVSRGCPYLCRFCVVGYVYTPNRWRDVEMLWKACEVGLQHTNRVGMLGAVVNLYPKMPDLTRRLLERGAHCSFASLRADSLSDAVVDAIQASGQETLTLAPETGDPDLRWFINKRMKNDALFKALEKGVTRGVRNFRLYFMMGIPGEGEANVAETIRIIDECHRMIREKAKPGATLSVSVSQFVPKAGTPFQWMPLVRAEDVGDRMKRVATRFKGAPGLRLNTESPRWCKIQGLLARGDRRLGRVMERVLWSSSASQWRRAMEEEGLDMDDMLYGARNPGDPAPWDVVQTPDLRERMLRELEKANLFAESRQLVTVGA
ncbi:MAG: radical SAM protein [Armatimonadetes bacterium]|nr:radical SAM protein [Armatimonadota bacterium]